MEEIGEQKFRDIVYRTMYILELESTEAKQMKALFRHASSMKPGENPELWGWIINQVPKEWQGKGGEISYSEYALYVVLAMYAIGPKDDKHQTIAEAAAQAKINRKKIAAVEGAPDMQELQIALRGLVKLIASKGMGFNYGKLAEDLVTWQMDSIKIVRKWEREYARKENNNEQ